MRRVVFFYLVAVHSLVHAATLEDAAARQSTAYDGAAARPAIAAPVAGAPGRGAAPLAPRKAAFPAPSRRFTGGYLGLEPESAYALTTGRAAGARAPLEGTWYFRGETIAVPKSGPPSLAWIGSTSLVEGVRLSSDGRRLELADGGSVPFDLVPKIASNYSFYDPSTAAFFRERTLRLRGEFVGAGAARRFVARTIWPEDFRVDFAGLAQAPARDAAGISAMIDEDDGGAREPFRARLLWARGGERAWGGRPVMGFMLNGAQGDDDEARAGHFSFFAGRFGPRGEMADWTFSNFYDMDSVSEKGIVAALVPLDKYMADVNSGQSFYRPTDMIVLVLKSDRAPRLLQERYRDLYARYYAHAVKYDRAKKSCTGLIVDELHAGGWNFPATGPTDPALAGLISAALPLAVPDEAKRREIADGMAQEKTRLFPRAAFEQLGGDALGLAGAAQTTRDLSPLEAMVREDIEAILYVRLPQIPSSRAFGSAPVGSIEQYLLARVRAGADWKTRPANPARPFPPPDLTGN